MYPIPARFIFDQTITIECNKNGRKMVDRGDAETIITLHRYACNKLFNIAFKCILTFIFLKKKTLRKIYEIKENLKSIIETLNFTN